MKIPFYMTLEGPEGSGKSTQINLVKDELFKRGLEVVVTREPGGTEIGSRIRGVLLDPDSKNLSPKAELLLYCADRAQHNEEVIKPALSSGKSVLSDRGPDATLLYQGYARGMDLELIKNLNNIALDGRLPDLTIFVAGDAEYFLNRAWGSIEKTGDTQTRFEQEALGFHKRVVDGIYKLAPTEKRYAIVEDREGDSIKTVNEKIMKVIYERLNL
ncbi:MAG: dTMP kinase [Candidatus Pacearchaeota archaeon]|jgi:dTMP kinase